MIDFHRHFKTADPLPSYTGVYIWYATSRQQEWNTLPSDRTSMHGYGYLPLEEDSSPLFSLEALGEAVSSDPLSYIGEVGDEPFFPLEKQLQQLKRVLALARELERPAFIHHRGSISALAATLGEFSSDIPIIIHQYSGSVETARELYRKGIYISLSPALREKKMKLSQRLGELDIPFLLETDYTEDEEDNYLDILTQHYEWVSRETGIPLLTLVEKQHEQSSILADRTAPRF